MRQSGDYIGELASYIRKNLKKGYTLDSLKTALLSQGHSQMEVSKAVKRAESDLAREAPVLETTPDITYEVLEPEDAIVEKKSWWKRLFGL